MKKSSCLKQIQQRLPEDIILEDETPFEFTDDEYVGILSWIKYFNEHYTQFGKGELPMVVSPLVSKRIRLDFSLYWFPCDIESNKGKHVIYITRTGKLLGGSVKKKLSVKELITNWDL